jgi:hypothetical protein
VADSHLELLDHASPSAEESIEHRYRIVSIQLVSADDEVLLQSLLRSHCIRAQLRHTAPVRETFAAKSTPG